MRESGVISKLTSTELSDRNTLSKIRSALEEMVESPDQYISILDKDDCHLYLQGSIDNIEAISICSTSGFPDLSSGSFYQNLTISLVWVKPSFRGTDYAKEFVTDVGYYLGREIAGYLEQHPALQMVYLESFAECRNQGGYNCCYWLSQLFAASFQLSELSASPLIRSFTTTFPGAEDPVPY